MFAVCMFVASSCRAESDGTGQAWFYQSAASRGWCSFVTEASAEVAASSGRFDGSESGWLRYDGEAIDDLTITTQSEDAYVEDTYTFGPDLTVKQVVRRGRYINDPYFSATFEPARSGDLRMISESRLAVRSWARTHETYFFDWPIYAAYSEIPFNSLIGMKSGISVLEACQENGS